jgi:hypothetical protein
MMTIQQELLFDIMESESDVNIFVDRPDFKAKGAAFIIISSPVGHFPKRKGDKFTLWFGRGVERFTFKTFNDAVAKTFRIMKTASPKLDINYRVEGRWTKRFNKQLAKLEVSCNKTNKKEQEQ